MYPITANPLVLHCNRQYNRCQSEFMGAVILYGVRLKIRLAGFDTPSPISKPIGRKPMGRIYQQRKKVRVLSKRRFYVQCGVFGRGISSAAMCVYFFLCKCANAQGTCYPSRETIGQNTGLCKSTVTLAVKELASMGLIEFEPQYRMLKAGKRRQTSNLYKILDLG